MSGSDHVWLRRHAATLREALAEQSLRLPRLDSSREVNWRVDCVLDSREMTDVNTPTVQIQLPVTAGGMGRGGDSASFEVGADKFRVLFNELKAAREIMDTVEG